MRFRTRPTLVEAFEMKPELSEYRIEMLFKALGYKLVGIKKENIKPFLSQLEIMEFTVINSEKRLSTIRCFYNEYICLQDEAFVVKTKAEFEREFEPIEPILDNLAYQLSLMG